MMNLSAGLGAGIFIFWILMSLIFSVAGLIVIYFLIKFALKNAIRESEVDFRLAVKRGVIEAHTELDNLKRSREKTEL